MDRKIQNFFLPWIILFNVFSCAFKMSAMQGLEGVKEEFPPLIGQELAKSVDLEEKIREIKKDIAEVKNVTKNLVVESRKKFAIDELKNRGGKGEIYLYDEKTGKGSIFEEKLIPMSGMLQGLLEGVEHVSSPVPISYPADIIKMVHEIFEECKLLPGTKDYAEKADALVNKKIKNIGDFSKLASILNCVHYLGANKEIKNPFIKKFREKTDSLFDENKRISSDELKILDTINIDLLQEIVAVKWDIFLEKMRFSIAKNKKIGSKPIFHTYSGPDNSVRNIVFSPNQNRLLVTTSNENLERRVQPPEISCIYVINTDGSIYKKIVKVTYHVVWIDDDTFAYIERNENIREYPSLNVFNCKTEKLITIPLDNDDISWIRRIIFDNEKIMFVYQDTQKKNGIATTCNIRELSPETKLTYTLFSWENDFTMDDFLDLDHNQFVLVGSSKDNPGKKGLYELKEISDVPIPIAELYDAGDKWKELDSRECSISLDRKKIAFLVSINSNLAGRYWDVNDIIIYSFETKQQIKCNINKAVYKVQFDTQGKLLLVGCTQELLIFSAITGEKICELKQSDSQAFEFNCSLALGGLGGNILVVGADSPSPTIWQAARGILATNVFIWELIPQEYLLAWNKLINQKQLSLSNRILLPSLYYRSSEGKKPVILTPDEKKSFHAIDPKVQEFFTDIDYVASGQMSTQSVKKRTSGYKSKTPPLKEAGRDMLKAGRSYWDWLKANFSWENLMKYFPSSG